MMKYYFKILLKGLLICIFVLFPLKLSISQDHIYRIYNPMGFNDTVIELNIETGIERKAFTLQGNEGIYKGITDLVSDPWHNRGYFCDYYSTARFIDFNSGKIRGLLDFPNGLNGMVPTSKPYISPNGQYILVSAVSSTDSKISNLYCINGDNLRIVSIFEDWRLLKKGPEKFLFDSSNSLFYHVTSSTIYIFTIPQLNLIDTVKSDKFNNNLPDGYKKRGSFKDVKSEKAIVLYYNKHRISRIAKLIDLKNRTELSDFYELPELDGVRGSYSYKVLLTPDAEFLFVYCNEVLYQHNALTGELISRLETPGLGKMNFPKYLFQDDRLYHIGTNINKIDWRNNTIISSVPIQEVEK